CDQRTGQYFPLPPHQQFQQCELLVGQVDALARPDRPPPRQVQLQIHHLHPVVVGGQRTTAQEAPHASQQLGKDEGFDQIVVCAQFKSLDAIVHVRQRGQKQH